MRIIRLQAEGFKRLVAVDITPDGDLIEVRGNNGEGKSSVLDAIFAALAGKDAAPIKPVRTGEEFALIRLDLGELRVTRYFGDDGATKLTVANADGAVYSQGQTMLDALVGSISFDPLEFAGLSADKQAAELRRLVKLDVDLDDLAAKDKADYAKRRDVNRDALAVKARVEAIVVPEGLPDVAPDTNALTDQLAAAGETNGRIEREAFRRISITNGGPNVRAQISRTLARAEELRKEAGQTEAEAARLTAERDEIEKGLESLPSLDEPIDVAALRAALAAADDTARKVARRDDRATLAGEFAALKAESEALTKAMTDRAEARDKALAAAEMPVPGLSLATIGDELVVTLDGEPFSQAASADQLKASVGIAMAANPRLRVLRIKDGSLLDKRNLAILSETAKANDFQIWGEFVGDEGAGIVMEAGKVRGAPEPERAESPKRRKAKGEATEDAASLSRATSPLAGDMAQSAALEPPESAPARKRPQAVREFTTKPGGSLL